MKTSPESPWPPIISKGRVPPFVQVRDFVLTVLAWSFIFYLIRDLLYYLWDYFSYPHFAYSRTSGPDWPALWQHLASFIYLAIFVVLWLTFFGIVRRRDLRRTKDSEQPPPLTIEELAILRGRDPEQLRQLQDEKIVVVHFNAERRVASVTTR